MTAFPASHINLPRQAEHTHTIVLLHGRNATGEEFADEIFEGVTSTGHPFASSDLFKGCKSVFPNARSVYSEQFQKDLTEWFDLASASDPHAEPERQTAGLGESIEHVTAIVQQEMKSLPASRIILVGISQGFDVAIHFLLSSNFQLAGFLGMSGWMPFQQQLEKLDSVPNASLSQFYTERLGVPASCYGDAVLSTPMLITHSEDDDVINVQFGRDAHRILCAMGAALSLEVYPTGGHGVNEPQGYDDIENFITGASREKGSSSTHTS